MENNNLGKFKTEDDVLENVNGGTSKERSIYYCYYCGKNIPYPGFIPGGSDPSVIKNGTMMRADMIVKLTDHSSRFSL